MKWKHYIKFEYTEPNTPQQNGKMECKFAALYGKIRSVLNAAGFPAFLRSILWSYAAKCVTQLDNTIVDSSTMTASEKFTGSIPKWFKSLRTFGELGITYNNQKIKGKLDNRGYPCMFIGYTEDHASNLYVFFSLNNQAIFTSHNVVWLHKLFHQHMKTKSALIPGFTAYDAMPATTNNQSVPPAAAHTISPAPIPQRLTGATTSRTFNPPTISSPSTSEDSDDDDDGTPIPPHATLDMTDTSYVIWRHFIILNQVIRVTLHYLHTVMILVKTRCLLILIKNLTHILKSFVMMWSFVMLIYLNMTVILNLLLKLY
jgi:hypothetical protein